MDNIPEAPTDAPQAPASVETPTNNEPAPAPAPEPNSVDLHGFTQADLAGMRTFIDNNGGWDAIKTKITAPKSIQPTPTEPQTPTPQPQAQPIEPQQPAYTPPKGSITAQEFLAQQYFQGLSLDPKYQGISEQIANGDVLKEMASFNIQPLNQDGSINDTMVRRYLDLKAQTVPAKGTGAEPNMSTAPTVDYVQATNGKVSSMDQAYAILQQDMQLKAQGLPGNPDIALAEEYIKTGGKPAVKK